MACVDWEDFVGRARKLGLPLRAARKLHAAHLVLHDPRSSKAAREAAARQFGKKK